MKWKTVLLRLCLSISLLFFYSSAFSQSEQTLSALTEQLKSMASEMKAGKPLLKEQYQVIQKTAKLRQKLFAENVRQAKDVTQYVLSRPTLEILSRAAKPYLEYEVGPLSGKLEVRAAELRNNKEEIQYLLYVDGDIYYLHFKDGAPRPFETDALVKVKTAMKIISKPNIYHLVLSHQDVQVKNPQYQSVTLGPQKTLTILVNFKDKPSDRPWTNAQINTLMYTTANQHFLESSFQQTSLVGQTRGWYVVNVNSTTDCDTLTSQVANLANQAAANDGVNVSQYTRKVYFFPKTNSCYWLGLGSVGSPTQSLSFINGSASTINTPAHELGHNFGLWHSKLLSCVGSPNTGNCTIYEYSDKTDLMGGGNTAFYNAFQKERLGWLNTPTSPPITSVTTSGTYTIDPYELNNKKPKALKILKRAGGSDYYYLEFRQGISFDAELASCGASCDYTRGVIFHQGNAVNGDSSELLDMSPSSYFTYVALLPGQSWTDPSAPNNGVTFRVVSANSTGAVVNVSYGSSCASSC